MGSSEVIELEVPYILRKAGTLDSRRTLENSFTVSAPTDFLWDTSWTLRRSLLCMQGAELTGVVDDRTWKGKAEMKPRPVAMSCAGTVTMDEREDDTHRVSLTAKRTETKGKGDGHADRP